MLSATMLTRVLLTPAGAVSGALVGAFVGVAIALPDPSSLAFGLVVASLGAAPGAMLGALAGLAASALLLAGDHLPWFRRGLGRSGVSAGAVVWGGIVWLLTSSAVAGLLIGSALDPVTRYEGTPEEQLAATLAQPIALSVTAAVLLAVGVGVERAVVIRSARRGGSPVP